jgi:hypothetical protein
MRGNPAMYRWLPGLLFLVAFPACGKSKGPPPVPVIQPMPMGAPTEIQEAVPGIRIQGGTPIAPVVLGDDSPAPAPAAISASPANARGPQGGSLNGDPRGLTRDSLNRSMAPVVGRIASCFSPGMGNPMVSLSFDAEPNGRTSLLRVKGAPPDSEYCIRKIMQDIKFPAFEGKAVPIDLPLSFHQVGKATSGGGPAGPSPAQPAPLFMDP